MELKIVTVLALIFLDLLWFSYSQVTSNGTTSPTTPPFGLNISEPFIRNVPTGSTVRLTCTAGSRGQRPVNISWSKVGDSLPQGRNYDDGNGHFVKVNASVSDSGTYVCTAYDQEYHTASNLTVTVTVGGPPQVSLYPTRQIIRLGDSPYINCSATGSQPINIYWSSVSGNALPRSASIDRGLLQFNDITLNDVGRYVCKAENQFGEASGVADVIVHGSSL